MGKLINHAKLLGSILWLIPNPYKSSGKLMKLVWCSARWLSYSRKGRPKRRKKGQAKLVKSVLPLSIIFSMPFQPHLQPPLVKPSLEEMNPSKEVKSTRLITNLGFLKSSRRKREYWLQTNMLRGCSLESQQVSRQKSHRNLYGTHWCMRTPGKEWVVCLKLPLPIRQDRSMSWKPLLKWNNRPFLSLSIIIKLENPQ